MKNTSGSVIGPLVAAELLKQDKNVICIAIGNTIGIIPAQNTIATLRSMDGVARKCSAPMVTMYFHNSPTVSVDQVNRDVCDSIKLIAMLFSGAHTYIDSKDVYNWLHYDQVTDYNAGLTLLDIFDTEDSGVDKLKAQVPIASLLTLGHSLNERYILGDDDADYHKVGLIHRPPQYSNSVSLFFALTTHGVPDIVKEHETRLEMLKSNAAAKRKQVVLSKDVSDDGMVL